MIAAGHGICIQQTMDMNEWAFYLCERRAMFCHFNVPHFCGLVVSSVWLRTIGEMKSSFCREVKHTHTHTLAFAPFQFDLDFQEFASPLSNSRCVLSNSVNLSKQTKVQKKNEISSHFRHGGIPRQIVAVFPFDMLVHFDVRQQSLCPR